MNYYFPNPIRQLMAFAGVVVILFTAAAAADATYFTHPGEPEQSGVTNVQWAEIDAGSLATIHRGPVRDVTNVQWAEIDAGSLATIHRGPVRDVANVQWAEIDAGSLATIHRGPVRDVANVQWAEIDAGSLATIHRSPPYYETVPIVYQSPDGALEATDSIASIIEGWFKAVAEAGAIGGILG